MGVDSVNKQQRRLGLEQTTLFCPLGDASIGRDARTLSASTASETVRLRELIARHEAVSADASEDMLRILRRRDYRHELTGLLPWNELNMLPLHSRTRRRRAAFATFPTRAPSRLRRPRCRGH